MIYFARRITKWISMKCKIQHICCTLKFKNNPSHKIWLCCFMLQSIVFHVSPHPDFPYFMQCVTFGSFSSRSHEVAYNLFCVIAMYFVPLLVIIVAYTAIMCEISNKSNENKGKHKNNLMFDYAKNKPTTPCIKTIPFQTTSYKEITAKLP